MTTHCANPSCGTRFQYFRSGKVFLIDFKSAGAPLKPPRDMEYFWLCGSCSPKMRVSVDSAGNVVLEQLETAGSPPRKIVAATTAEWSAKKRLSA